MVRIRIYRRARSRIGTTRRALFVIEHAAQMWEATPDGVTVSWWVGPDEDGSDWEMAGQYLVAGDPPRLELHIFHAMPSRWNRRRNR